MITVLDSWGRPGPGIMSLYPVFRGVYDQCQNVRARKPPHMTQVKDRYGEKSNTKEPSTYEKSEDSHAQGQSSATQTDAQNAYVSKMAAFGASKKTHGKIHRNISSPISPHGGHSKHTFLEVVNYLDKYFNPKDKDFNYEPAFRGKYCRVGVSSYAIPMNINVVVGFPSFHLYWS